MGFNGEDACMAQEKPKGAMIMDHGASDGDAEFSGSAAFRCRRGRKARS
jgi:hypothetical protein